MEQEQLETTLGGHNLPTGREPWNDDDVAKESILNHQYNTVIHSNRTPFVNPRYLFYKHYRYYENHKKK